MLESDLKIYTLLKCWTLIFNIDWYQQGTRTLAIVFIFKFQEPFWSYYFGYVHEVVYIIIIYSLEYLWHRELDLNLCQCEVNHSHSILWRKPWEGMKIFDKD